MRQRLIDFLAVFNSLNKSLVMLLLMTVGVWFRLKGYLSGDNMVDLLKTTTVSYFGAHVAQHFTTMISDHLASKNAPVATDNESDDVPVEVDVQPSVTKNGK